MPLCISCRGEYSTPSYICTRCGENNEHWYKWANAGGIAHFRRFFVGFWGLQTLLSFILPIIAAITVDFTPVASERIGIPLAVLLIFVNVALLYTVKDSLWRYDLQARIGRGFKPPLVLLSVITFVLALVFGLVIVFMLEAQRVVPEARPTEGIVRVITTILLAMTFVNVTLSAMFMAAHSYGNWLNREMPQPIYAQERRLLSVIENGLREKIRQAMGEDDLREKVRQAIMGEDHLREKIRQAMSEDDLREKMQEIMEDLQEKVRQAMGGEDLQMKIQQTMNELRAKIGQVIGEDDLRKRLQQVMSENNLQEKIRQVTSKDRLVETTITDMERMADAGIILLINAETDVDQISGKETFKQIQSLRVIADRWGRIQKMQTEGTPRYILIEKGVTGADNGKKADEAKPEPAKEGELILPGESYMMTQNDTTISITSKRRHSVR